MLRRYFLTALALGLFALPTSPLYARDQQTGSIKVEKFDKKADVNLAKVTIQDALNVAMKEVNNGKVIDAELKAENGYLVYEIEIVTPDKKVTRVLVDAGNSKVLSTEAEKEG
ncbi:MAG: PepSY domain-containing protein [Bdellovibrionia bacterium]